MGVAWRLVPWLLPVLLATAAAASQPDLCSHCACLDGVPFVVDCAQTSLTEVTLMTSDSYQFPWVVFFDDNFITHISVIPYQEELLKLSFRMNYVSSIADGAFANLTRLRSLNLSYCNLTKNSFTADAFRGPPNFENKHTPLESLQELDISHNHIASLRSHAFNHLIQLQTLIMTDNQVHDFTRDTISAFTELGNLRKLDISRNHLARLPQQFLAGMRKLEELLLGFNQLTAIPEEVLYAKSLRILNLDNNPIKVISPMKWSSVPGLKSLTELSLCHMPLLESVEREGLAGMQNLTKLSMTDNPNLEHIDKLAFLSKLVGENKLKEVYLQNNGLRTLHEDLLDWDSLVVLDIQHNPWSCDCHIKWITEGPIQRMITVEPKRTRYIVCATPHDVTGQNIKHLVATEYSFPCPYSGGSGVHAHLYGPLIIVTISVGLTLLVSATMLCTYALYQRSKESHKSGRTVHYRRATGNDLESMAERMDS